MLCKSILELVRSPILRETMSLIEKTWKTAITFFATAKKGGMKWYGIVPYHWHLRDVATLCSTLFPHLGDEAVALAILHDNVEEGDGGLRKLGFSERLVAGVEALAIDLDEVSTAIEGYEAIRSHGELAIAVKLADRVANCTRCLTGWVVSFDYLEKESWALDFLSRVGLVVQSEAEKCGGNAEYLKGYHNSYPRFRNELYLASKCLGEAHSQVWLVLDHIHTYIE